MAPRHRRGRLWVVIGIAVLMMGGLGYSAWRVFLVDVSVDQATSPDGRYEAVVTSTFGLFSNQYEIKISETTGQDVRHLVMKDKLPGWATNPSLSWSADSKTLIVGVLDTDSGTAVTRVEIDMP